MAEENMGMEPAPGSPPPGASRRGKDSLYRAGWVWTGRCWFKKDTSRTGKTLLAEIPRWSEAVEYEALIQARSAPEASSPKGPTNVTPELPRAPRAHGEKEGGGT